MNGAHHRLRGEEDLPAVAVAAELDAFLRHPDFGGAVFRRSAGPVGIPVGPLPGGPLELPLALQLLLHAPVGQREHLEAAAVGDQRPVPPSDKIMQPPGVLDDLRTRMQKQMVRVAEHQLLPGGVRLPKIEALQCAVGRHRHEAGGVDDPVPAPRRVGRRGAAQQR